MKNEWPEVEVPVHSFCLLKRIVDDDCGDLHLVGTLIQYVNVSPELSEETKKTIKDIIESKDSDGEATNGDELFFQYRFNDLTAEEGGAMIQPRMTERFNNDTLLKKTYQFKAPLAVDEVFNCFPFKIATGSLIIEHSSSTLAKHKLKLRPNLVVSTKDKRNNISIQVPLMEKSEHKSGFLKWFKIEDKMDEVRMLDAIDEQMDKMGDYELLRLFPRVQYFSHPKKGCSKYRVQFYLVEEGNSKLVEILAPMLLVAVMNTLNVMDDDPDLSSNDFLANAATFALTAVFILPTIKGKSNRTRLLSFNNFYILLVFIGLTLSSIPEKMAGSKGYAWAGMGILWSSFLVPFFNAFYFLHKFLTIQNPLKENFIEGDDYKEQKFDEGDDYKEQKFDEGDDYKEQKFDEGDDYKEQKFDEGDDYKEQKFDPKKHDFNECFKPVKELLKDENKMKDLGYKKKRKKLGKFDILGYKEKMKVGLSHFISELMFYVLRIFV